MSAVRACALWWIPAEGAFGRAASAVRYGCCQTQARKPSCARQNLRMPVVGGSAWDDLDVLRLCRWRVRCRKRMSCRSRSSPTLWHRPCRPRERERINTKTENYLLFPFDCSELANLRCTPRLILRLYCNCTCEYARCTAALLP